MPDKLWSEVCDIVQEAGIKTIPWKRNAKKAKWLSGEALQIAVKRKEVKSKGEKNTHKTDLRVPDNHNGVITHLEPDILECEVKWALEGITTNKASGGDGIPVELFQILRDDSVKVLHSVCQQVGKTQQWPQDWKRSVFIPIPPKGQCQRMFKLLHNCTHLTR